MKPNLSPTPLVSIICFCKNRALTIRRSIESVLGQSYRHIEFVVQDGASEDGTLQVLRGYQDDRIKIVSETDSGPPEAFWKAINRCQGEIIGTCLSDEELLPGAIERAVSFFQDNPRVGALTCDGWVTDIQGKITGEFNAGEFNFIDYLFASYCPFWPGSFFRKQALIEVGLKNHDWTIECLEFEIWCRLATRHVVKHLPVRMSKYAVHESQLSNTKQYFLEHFESRAKVIRRLFSEDGFFGKDEIKLNACLYNQMYIYYNHVRAYRLVEQQDLLFKLMRDLRASIPLLERPLYREYFDFLDNDSRVALGGVIDEAAVFRWISSRWLMISLAVPLWMKRLIPGRVKKGAHQLFQVGAFYAATVRQTIRHLVRERQLVVHSASRWLPRPLKFSPKLYHDCAKLYYARGQIDEALEMWRRAGELQDPEIDGLACQAQLMSPTATYPDLLRSQQNWARRHARIDTGLPPFSPPPSKARGRVRVGYYCSFMEGDTIRFIMLPVLREHDRRQFEIYGYSLADVPIDIRSGFEHHRATGAMSDREFVAALRADQLDVLVEMSGFSPFHRFAAMASRCATVQVSYLNHTGTSAVSNVDYVLADEISLPRSDDIHFTEQIWRLPGSFLSYTYDAVDMPPVAPPPCIRLGYPTFGYFGSGGKLGTELIEIWAEILNRVPDSRMVIRNMQLASADNRRYLVERFARYGVEKERISVMEGGSRLDILAAYADVDVSLDTWPYCGGNTIAEALWQGAPVVTLKSGRFSGRYGASLLEAAGCPELVAESIGEYVQLSVALCADHERLSYYRKNLRQMCRESGLSAPQPFARKLENAFKAMLAEKTLSSQAEATGLARVQRLG